MVRPTADASSAARLEHEGHHDCVRHDGDESYQLADVCVKTDTAVRVVSYCRRLVVFAACVLTAVLYAGMPCDG